MTVFNCFFFAGVGGDLLCCLSSQCLVWFCCASVFCAFDCNVFVSCFCAMFCSSFILPSAICRPASFYSLFPESVALKDLKILKVTIVFLLFQDAQIIAQPLTSQLHFATIFNDSHWIPLSTLEHDESFIGDARWEGLPIVSEVILNVERGRRNITLSVQGSPEVEVEVCFEDEGEPCVPLLLEIKNSTYKWRHFSINLDEEKFSIQDDQHTFPVTIEYSTPPSGFTENYLRYGIGVHNRTAIATFSKRKLFIRKIGARKGHLKLHDCTILF